VLTTPLQYGCEYEDVTVAASDGLMLSGWYIPCPDAKGSVIFCHGYSGNRTPVCYYLELFRKHKLNVLACDFRGHGKSPGWTAAFGAREYHDIVGAEDYLRRRVPGKPILLFGISYGAAVTIQSLPHLHDVRAAWAEAGFARLSGLWVRKFTDVPETLRSPTMNFYNGIVWVDSGFAPLRVNAIDRIKDGHIPLFFCHGDKDEIVPLTDSMEMYSLYPGPKEYLWLEGAGHGNLVTVGGEEYQRRFADFVTRYLFSKS
jgi:pimeloyl-ACP methyl ester carboxylesterase